jgi:hypothetical protein
MGMVRGLLAGGAGGLMDDSRIHPSYQQQANNLLFGAMQHPSHPQAATQTTMQSYLQELSDNTLLQRQQLHLQELQARHQLLLRGGSRDITSDNANVPTNNTARSYPATWFELQEQSQQQQQSQQEMQHHHHQQTMTAHQDGELQKLNPGNKSFAWQQTQLLQDQHLQQHLQGVELKEHHLSGDMKKLASAMGLGNQMQSPLKQAPAPGVFPFARAAAATGVTVEGNAAQPSLHNLASKLDNDAISFLAEFRFNGNSSSSSSEGTN